MCLANKMRRHRVSITDVAGVEKNLWSRTPMFDYIVCSIEEANNIEKMQIDKLKLPTSAWVAA